MTDVARACLLEELLREYRDFLRLRIGEERPANRPRAKRLGHVLREPEANGCNLRKALEPNDPVICGSAIAGLRPTVCPLGTELFQGWGLRERMPQASLNTRK